MGRGMRHRRGASKTVIGPSWLITRAVRRHSSCVTSSPDRSAFKASESLGMAGMWTIPAARDRNSAARAAGTTRAAPWRYLNAMHHLPARLHGLALGTEGLTATAP